MNDGPYKVERQVALFVSESRGCLWLMSILGNSLTTSTTRTGACRAGVAFAPSVGLLGDAAAARRAFRRLSAGAARDDWRLIHQGEPLVG